MNSLRHPVEFGPVDATRVIGNRDGLDVYVNPEMIEAQLASLAEVLPSRWVADPDQSVLFCPVLNGGAFFYHDLARALGGRADVHTYEVVYVHASRYGPSTRGSENIGVEWIGLGDRQLRGRTVVVVDDILDEGRTVEAVARELTDRGVEEVVTAFACRKVPVKTTFPADYVLFDIPSDIWAVGYGMDLDQRYRAVRSILAART